MCVFYHCKTWGGNHFEVVYSLDEGVKILIWEITIGEFSHVV